MWVMYRKDWASGIWAKRVWQMGVANGCGKWVWQWECGEWGVANVANGAV